MKNSFFILKKALLILFPVFAVLTIICYIAQGFEGMLIFLGAIAINVILFSALILFRMWVNYVDKNL